jgi:DNA polymerase-3 subunit delta
VLILDVKTWAASTRLAKMLPGEATITCVLPKNREAQTLRSWLPKWAKEQHARTLDSDATTLLLDLVGHDMGLLDQELAKLAVYVGDAPVIKATDVDKLVGHNRERTAWQMLDAAAEGNREQALQVLGRLFDQGEEPLAILGAVGWQVRRLAQTGRLVAGGLSVGAAMARVGMPPFAQQRVERHLRRLGSRTAELFDWLLEADLAMKSSGQLPGQVVLERLLVRLAG